MLFSPLFTRSSMHLLQSLAFALSAATFYLYTTWFTGNDDDDDDDDVRVVSANLLHVGNNVAAWFSLSPPYFFNVFFIMYI